ncbi:hypothetical protein [Sphingobium chungbukense]|uniref:Uncharacterized protein n=1 Tax=Sphingobium chungbukense TaxID=56193 RepID=A0A0M3AVA4_9SPHN|nr:hypothetical protein [Sphingobium chungbukense]KKW93858.1 hypothetical protein YP76_04150 [Sphingobium chungbukense]
MIEMMASIVGPRAAKPVLWALTAMLVLILLSVGYCSLRGGEREQAQQTTKSSEAIADAAKGAVSDISNQTKAETAIDAAVATVKEEVGYAVDPAAIHSAVARDVCVRREYRNDPACALR